jgi:hypothetical protein
MIDLLDRMITDAKVRASRVEAQRTRPVSPSAASGSYGAVLREQLAREAYPPSLSGEGEGRQCTQQSLPRSLVLVTTETFCMNCGACARAPGYAILAEYAFNEVSLCRTMDDVRRHEKRFGEQWLRDHSTPKSFDSVAPKLPREHRTLTVHAPACEACF